MTTHSPSIVNGLPKEAIKVFFPNPNNGRFIVKENLTPEEAFYHIEYSVDSRKNIIVEDVLAEQIINGVLKSMGDATHSLFNIKFNQGGESVIKKEFATVYCRDDNPKNFIFFDGDQKPIVTHYNWRVFPINELTVANLKTKVRSQTNEEIKFSVDSQGNSGNQEQQLDLLKKYLDYYLNYVFYLPKNIPEEIIWDENLACNYVECIFNSEKFEEYNTRVQSENNYKMKFSILAEYITGDNSSDSILGVQKQFIQAWLNKSNDDFNDLKISIEQMIIR